jgi:hypothetical protein
MMKLLLVLLGVAFCAALPASVLDDATALLQTGLTTGAPASGLGALNVTALTIDAGAARESAIALGDGENAFTIRMTADGQFKIDHRGLSGMVVSPDGDVTVNGKIIASGDVSMGSDSGGSFSFKGLPQWTLFMDDQFDQGGWTNASTSTCGGSPIPILGGYAKFSGGEVARNYRQLPDHTEIRIKANFHFIDSWTGEWGYAKLDHQTVWSDIHDAQSVNTNALNICGGPTHEGKFAVPIDVTIAHTSSSIGVLFGSTLKKPATEASWGISSLQIYIR